MLGAIAKRTLHTNILTQNTGKLIEEYTTELTKFKVMFKIFETIETGDKIGKAEGSYIIYKGGRLQKMWRWLYSENRQTSFNHIDADFANFFKLCDKIKQNNYVYTPNNTIKKLLLEILQSVIPGLYNLKESYNNTEEEHGKKLCCKIDSIILTLIDMRTEVKRNPNNLHKTNSITLCPGVRTNVPVKAGMAFSL